MGFEPLPERRGAFSCECTWRRVRDSNPCQRGGVRCPASALGGGCGIRTREGVNPTRFPSERHRPLGESSAGEGTGPPGRAAELGGTRGATYTADNPPCG